MPAVLPTYDVAIIGGGLAGLSAAIQLARCGFSVVLLEKEQYPFHKVCGEYLSMESWNYLESLGLPLSAMNPPRIRELFLSAPSGKFIEQKLSLGGFGISRYQLDLALAQIAMEAGVHLLQNCKVQQVESGESCTITYSSAIAGQQKVNARICLGAFGKRSNLELKWRDNYKDSSSTPNYVAVKYHVHSTWDKATIGLHNFSGGYCGISAIEDDKFCLCYMVRASQLKLQKNDLSSLEQNVLGSNPHLENILASAEKLPGFPVTISQIDFQKKPFVRNDILMVGDAAGMIAPLAGNGMSIALHTGKIAAGLAEEFLMNRISQQQMTASYGYFWRRQFGTRFWAGRNLQKLFGQEKLTGSFIAGLRLMPFLKTPLIKLTHGSPF